MSVGLEYEADLWVHHGRADHTKYHECTTCKGFQRLIEDWEDKDS